MSFYGSLMTSLSSLESHTQQLNVIGQNITNMNTVGYRDRNIEFATLLGDPKSGAGSFGRVQTKTNIRAETNGIFQPTLTNTDMAMSGRGFFAVRQTTDGTDDVMFTRDGSFRPDENGYLRNKGGLYLQGYPIDAETFVDTAGVDQTVMEPIRVEPDLNFVQGITTTEVRPRLNFPAENRESVQVAVPVYNADSTKPDSIVTNWEPVAGEGNQWTVSFSIPDGTSAPSVTAPVTLSFDQRGKVIAPQTTALDVTWSPYTDPQTQETVDRGTETFTFDWSDLVIGGNSFVSYDTGSNGSPKSYFTGLNFDDSGVMYLNKDNGPSRPSHVVAIGMFRAPQSLTEIDANTFMANDFTGAPIFTVPGQQGAGSFLPMTVEMSNSSTVDLLAKMIEAQRAYTFSSSALRTTYELMQITSSLK